MCPKIHSAYLFELNLKVEKTRRIFSLKEIFSKKNTNNLIRLKNYVLNGFSIFS